MFPQIKKITLTLFLLLRFFYVSQAQPTWDNPSLKNWPKEITEISVTSSADNSQQRALLFSVKNKKEKRPLIVSLHTWSGDYLQNDPQVKEAIDKDYYYVHPDFRGPNLRKEATGSPLVISDIEDIIRYLIKTENVDPNEIHIVGVSGGGYATLLCYNRLKIKVKSFSAWVPISDLQSWYYETQSRHLPYTEHILKSTSDGKNPDFVEMRKRSPLFDNLKGINVQKSDLQIFAGVNDGYTGSVPITHAINFYNKLAQRKSEKVSDRETIKLLTQRQIPEADLGFLEGRKVYLHKKSGKVSLTIFDGTHEQLTKVALSLLPIDNQKVSAFSESILTIGPSNEYAADSWVNQLPGKLPFSNIVNYSIPGNTCGFDNLGNKKLNTISQIDSLVKLGNAKNYGKPFKYLAIALGTNDCKAIFNEDFEKIKENYQNLIEKLKTSDLFQKDYSQFILMTPPPIDHTKAIEKYNEGNACEQKLNASIENFCKKENAVFINSYEILIQNLTENTTDGVHLTTPAQSLITELLIKKLEK